MRQGNAVFLLGCLVLFSALTVFTPASGAVHELAKLTASDGAEDDYFGRSVGISGDRIVVGAYSAAPYGAAYVYERGSGGWTEATKLTATGARSFGTAVAVSGDTTIVGAVYSYDAYIFERGTGGWAQTSRVTGHDTEAGDEFGSAATISGDTAIVGARFADHSGMRGAGAAYVFERDGGSWTEAAKLTAADASPHSGFGYSVSLCGDRAVIAAWTNDHSGLDRPGSAYVFERGPSGWTQTVKLTASDPGENDRFGSSVSIDGDRVLVGAIYDDDDGGESGSAYIFEKRSYGWDEIAKLTASDAAANDRFGVAVAISGQYVLVGAQNNDDGPGEDSGSAYLFQRGMWGWEEIKLTASDGAWHDLFGKFVAMTGDYAVIGCLGDDSLGENAGAAYVYRVPEPSAVGVFSIAALGLLRRRGGPRRRAERRRRHR